MKIKDSEALSEWLEKKLRHLCEADPVALSKYVLALVEKDREVEELRQLCADQLEVFLGQETVQFIESLFLAIAKETYIMSSSGEGSTPTEDGTTPPLPPNDADEDSPASTGKSQARNRRHTEIDDEDRDFKRARRGRSSSSTPSPERSPTHKTFPSPISFHPSTEGAQKARSGSVGVKPKTWRGQGGGGRIMQPRMPAQLTRFPGLTSAFNPFMPNMMGGMTVGAKRERCKDFDEKGVCMLGESCPFDHGVDPLVVGPMMQWPLGGAQLGPSPLGVPSAGVRAPGLPGLVMPGGFGQHPTPAGLPSHGLRLPVMSTGLASSASASSSSTATAAVEADGYNPENPTVSGAAVGGGVGLLPQPGIVPGVGGLPVSQQGGRPLQRGVKRPQRVPTDCLIVRNLPPEKNTVTELSTHFQQFGTIINIRVRFNNDQQSALVQFSSVAEAQKAFESSDAVCGNRFVKVFYFKVQEGGPGRRRGREEILDVTTGVQLVGSAAGVMGSALTQPTSKSSSSVESSPKALSVGTSSTVALSKTDDATAFSSSSTATSVADSHHLDVAKGQAPLPPSNKALHSKQLAFNKKVASLQKQLGSVEESLKKKRELQNKVQELINKQIEGQKMLIAKLDNSKSLSDAERKKVMETLKEVTAGVSKLNDQAQVMKTAILKLTNEKQSVEVSLGEARADLKAVKDAERQLAESAKAELAKAAQKKDLRNKLNKRKLVVMNVAKEDHLKLAQLFESVGQLLEVSVDPTNEKNMIITFVNRVDAEKAVRSITSFNSKPVIMKWYSVPLQLPTQQMKVEAVPVASLPLSVSPKLKKPAGLPRLDRQLSESDDLRLLSPDSDCGGLLTPGALSEKVLDDSLLDDDK